MGLIDYAMDAFRFKETFFYKENSNLQDEYNSLIKLTSEYPSNNQ